MKRFLTLLSSMLIIPVSASSAVSCSSVPAANRASNKITPPYGWPPLEKAFLPVWKNFMNQVQGDISRNSRDMRNEYGQEYTDLFYKFRDINRDKRGDDGFDKYGVPNDKINKILNNIATSPYMVDYQKNSLRLYYIELNVSYLESGKKKVAGAEEENIWAMKYFRSYPFYEYVEMYLNDPENVMYSVPINYNFYDFGAYIYPDSQGNADWSRGPKKHENFHPTLKLEKSYYSMADEIYSELFGKGKSHD